MGVLHPLLALACEEVPVRQRLQQEGVDLSCEDR